MKQEHAVIVQVSPWSVKGKEFIIEKEGSGSKRLS
jgi:hypothetical protein